MVLNQKQCCVPLSSPQKWDDEVHRHHLKRPLGDYIPCRMPLKCWLAFASTAIFECLYMPCHVYIQPDPVIISLDLVVGPQNSVVTAFNWDMTI